MSERKLFRLNQYLRTHPDKIADQISNAILDAILESRSWKLTWLQKQLFIWFRACLWWELDGLCG